MSHANNFNLLRFVAATMVLFSHCWPLAVVSDTREPLSQLIDVSLGTMAVCAFFSISGYLVGSSWDRNPRVAPFVAARAARILPGLFIVLALTVFVLGPLLTTLPLGSYFTQADTWTYLLRNLTLMKLQTHIPGVLEGAKLNGSLWTLPYEVACYCVLLALALCGALKRFAIPAILLMALAAFGHTSYSNMPYHLATFWMSFSAGICLWKWRAPMSGHFVLLLVFVAGLAMHFHLWGSYVLFTQAIALATLYLALVPAGFVRRFNRFGDYSYGIYIYAWPVQQVVHSVWPTSGVLGMFTVAFPVTLFCAALSWRYIESPALKWVKHVFQRRVGQFQSQPAET